MDSKDILSAVASILIILIVVGLLVLAIVFLFTLGSPLVLIGLLLGLGIFGIGVLVGILIAMVMIWYALYAFIKDRMEGEKKPEKGNYTLGRIKKS